LSQPGSSINLPNVLTIVRILLVPIFILLLVRQLYPLALFVFAIAGLTDGLDGFIARYFNQRTALGAWLDPMADKLLLVSAFVALAILGVIPPWITVLAIARDVIITLGIVVLTLTEKKYEVRPSVASIGVGSVPASATVVGVGEGGPALAWQAASAAARMSKAEIR
jgi:cardiolipin synthase